MGVRNSMVKRSSTTAFAKSTRPEIAGVVPRETLFARVRIAADEPTRVLPSKDGVELKLRFRKAVATAD